MRDALYQAHILDHANHPRFKGPLAGATVSAVGSNPSCGDQLTLHLAIEEGRIARASFEGEGCALSQAGASLLACALQGMPLQDAFMLSDEAYDRMLGVAVSRARVPCVRLAYTALRRALGEVQG